MYQESEIVDLLMVLFLLPVMRASLGSIHLEGRRFFIAGYLAIIAAYVFTIVEGFWIEGVFNALEHLSYTVAGVLFALGALVLLRASRKSAVR